MNKLSRLRGIKKPAAKPEPVGDMVHLKTTNKTNGQVYNNGPYERGFIEKWINHAKDTQGCTVLGYEVIG